ncbi:hypothetical protein [Paenibacillus sp. 481]|uniref:hypothetical protein n=1 Tax=Paenibacillus sp. 481 TaxID=2835869 RepID=UPI001E526327|nr:hypothetical protein [Paenibacillus sp. 481]UHA74751.1 hypothetical protein KIK04_06710 [Paenibacillus sp. 481]
MSLKLVRPPRKDPAGKSTFARKSIAPSRITPIGPIFSRLTVVWVNRNGVPFNTTGFFALAFVGNTLISTAFFDNFGVVRFNNINTLTNVPITIRTFNAAGFLFRTRHIPAGVETFAIIG